MLSHLQKTGEGQQNISKSDTHLSSGCFQASLVMNFSWESTRQWRCRKWGWGRRARVSLVCALLYPVRERDRATPAPWAHTLLWVRAIALALSFSTQRIGFGDPGNPGLAARLCAVNIVPLLGQTAACNNTEFKVELGRSVTRHSQTELLLITPATSIRLFSFGHGS